MSETLQLFIQGGPIMWPLLLTSIITLSVVIERLWFILKLRKEREPDAISRVFELVEKHSLSQAEEFANRSKDPIVRVLAYGLKQRKNLLTGALVRAAALELKRVNRGISVLDTVITLAPLLGLLGTVTGMIRAFGLLGTQELSAPVAITGGVAEALIATAFGLGIAIVALIPFNYLNTLAEEIRHEIEDAGTRLEILFQAQSGTGEITHENKIDRIAYGA